MPSEMVSFAANGGAADGYLAVPDQPGPGVLVIQEWWGLVGHIKEVADRFAEAGFTALAPDLFHGEQTTSPDAAGKLLMALEVDRAEQDLRGAADYLATVASGDSVGVVGFCMGGQLALYAASKSPRIGACVDFYGVQPERPPRLRSDPLPGPWALRGKGRFRQRRGSERPGGFPRRGGGSS